MPLNICFHRWIVKSKETEPSIAELLFKDPQFKSADLPQGAFARTYFVHYVCTLCGREKVKKL